MAAATAPRPVPPRNIQVVTAAAPRLVSSESSTIENGLDFGRARRHEGAATSEVEGVDIFDYPDTKIKLHFSHFKRLPASRVTCFHEPPHQCKDDPLRESSAEDPGRGDEL